jgi:hypothetical protein
MSLQRRRRAYAKGAKLVKFRDGDGGGLKKERLVVALIVVGSRLTEGG